MLRLPADALDVISKPTITTTAASTAAEQDNMIRLAQGIKRGRDEPSPVEKVHTTLFMPACATSIHLCSRRAESGSESDAVTEEACQGGHQRHEDDGLILWKEITNICICICQCIIGDALALFVCACEHRQLGCS